MRCTCERCVCDPLNKANRLSPINHGCQTSYSCAAFWVLGWQKAKEISRWQLAGCKSWILRSLTRSPKRGQSGPKPSMPLSVLLIGLRSNAALSNTLWSCIQSLPRWFLTASYGASRQDRFLSHHGNQIADLNHAVHIGLERVKMQRCFFAPWIAANKTLCRVLECDSSNGSIKRPVTNRVFLWYSFLFWLNETKSI